MRYDIYIYVIRRLRVKLILDWFNPRYVTLQVVFVICVQSNIRFRNFCLLCDPYSIHIYIYGTLIFAYYFVCVEY